jgi:hypothetical protein
MASEEQQFFTLLENLMSLDNNVRTESEVNKKMILIFNTSKLN